MQANISGRTNLWMLEITSWSANKHIYMNLELQSTFSSPIREVTIFHLTWADPKPVNNVLIFITSGFVCATLSLNWLKRLLQTVVKKI